MHEISLVQGMLSQLTELADNNGATKVIKITMEIGPLSGVVIDSFTFGFDILSAENDLTSGAELVINVPPVAYGCTKCNHSVQTTGDRPDACPQCGELFLIPEGGDDIILQQVEME